VQARLIASPRTAPRPPTATHAIQGFIEPAVPGQARILMALDCYVDFAGAGGRHMSDASAPFLMNDRIQCKPIPNDDFQWMTF
jgi:hypothetical protein